MSTQPIYEVRNVHRRYGHIVALDGVSMSLRAGEVVGLVGDNGAGKSTLVRVLSGASAPDEGEILFEGTPRRWTSPHDALQNGIETLYQDSGIAPDLSVAANVFLGREILKPGLAGWLGFLDERAMRERTRLELEKIGVSVPASRRTVTELSGGQRQAVAIGRAVAWAKKVIILDEPTNHLGARQAGEVLGVIRRARERGLGVIFISHTLPHILEVTDRVVVLRLGKVAAEGPTSGFDHNTLLKEITGLKVRTAA